MSSTVSILQSSVSSVGNSAEFKLLQNTSKKQRVHLDAVCVLLSTDATVANRYIKLKVYDSKDVCLAAVDSAVQAASLGYRHSFTRSVTGVQTGQVDLAYALPKLWLDPFEYITLTVAAGVVGDVASTTVKGYTERVVFSN